MIGKPDLAPDAWVKKLVTLCDAAPTTPYSTIIHVLEQELGIPVDLLFEEFDKNPIGSASVAQVQNTHMHIFSFQLSVLKTCTKYILYKGSLDILIS